jgi:hypothetical protein
VQKVNKEILELQVQTELLVILVILVRQVRQEQLGLLD